METDVEQLSVKLDTKGGRDKKIRLPSMASMLPLKKHALGLPEPLRTLILSQPDEIPMEEYIIKTVEWGDILRLMKKS
jgi:hypothetical protein